MLLAKNCLLLTDAYSCPLKDGSSLVTPAPAAFRLGRSWISVGIICASPSVENVSTRSLGYESWPWLFDVVEVSSSSELSMSPWLVDSISKLFSSPSTLGAWRL